MGVVWLLWLAASITLHSLSPANAAETRQSTRGIDEQRLAGRWLRPDGGYILELTEVTKDGTLKAVYLNPRPINVAKAVFSQKDGRLTIFVELRDVNYPGSQYSLQYDPKTDRLIGTYFQAVLSQTFNVEFVRLK